MVYHQFSPKMKAIYDSLVSHANFHVVEVKDSHFLNKKFI